jgi:hypothetical protein
MSINIYKLLFKYILKFAVIISISSCTSYKQFQYIVEEFEMPSQVFKSDYNQTWQAVLQVMKTYDLAIQNQESGIIKTRWVDNTIELNFTDSFGSNDTVKSAKFKVIVNIVKGYRGTREVSKVTVFKRQLVELDFLQGWKEQHTDGIFEKTLLYRISRVIKIDTHLQKIEKERQSEVESTF